MLQVDQFICFYRSCTSRNFTCAGGYDNAFRQCRAGTSREVIVLDAPDTGPAHLAQPCAEIERAILEQFETYQDRLARIFEGLVDDLAKSRIHRGTDGAGG